MRLDRSDIILLRELQKHGRATNVELANRTGLSESSCLRRTRQLEESGAIERYSAILNPQVVGWPLNIFISVSLESQAEASLRAFEKEIASVPEVMECYLMTGSADYLVRIAARDVEDLERIHSTRLTKLTGVSRVTSSIAMRQVVRRQELPLGMP